MSARTALVALAAVMGSAVTGCVLNIEVQAEFVDGQLVFGKGMDGEKQWCIDRFRLTDRAGGKVVWSIESDPAIRTEQFCDRDFPLKYGTAPSGFVTKIGAHRLVSGRVYEIDGWNGNVLSGAFRYTVVERVENVEPDSTR